MHRAFQFRFQFQFRTIRQVSGRRFIRQASHDVSLHNTPPTTKSTTMTQTPMLTNVQTHAHVLTHMQQTRGKKKKAGAHGHSHNHKLDQIDLRSDIMELIDLEGHNNSMQKTVDSLSTSYSRLRCGIVSPTYLDDVAVEAYGSRTTLKTLAQVSIRDGRTLFVTTFDDQVVSNVEKAIRKSELNLNPIAEGNGRLRIPIPKPSKESRLAMKETVQKEAEAAKVAVRMIRRKGVDEVKNVKDDISKDDVKRLENKIQLMTDKCILKIDELAANKIETIIDAKQSIRK